MKMSKTFSKTKKHRRNIKTRCKKNCKNKKYTKRRNMRGG